MRLIEQPLLLEAYRHVIRLLRSVKHYPYHNIGHTLDVFGRTRKIGVSEGISDGDLVDLLFAALFHDTGFTESYRGNEVIGARIAREWLSARGYPKDRIQKIESVILATVPFSPTKNILEEIIQDADLDNLGRDDCFAKMKRVEEELVTMAGMKKPDIYAIFRSLHTRYHFHTKTSKRERQEKKLENARKFEEIEAAELGK